ncbi:MAG: SAM-dependent chlorinase/fluorinase [Candidatus Poribacteria bacterium]|nr:SAM-dependent chlorinase/fluorinase [Candidatus Poribacteria bacterium]
MSESSRIITLTTDFGIRDTYVGIMKGVILGINLNVQVVDLTHAIPPQDIYEAAFSINAAHSYFPRGTIHVIVVDPGVGSDRRAIVCQTDNAFFVCPDNGVLSYLLQSTEDEAEQPINAVEIQNKAYYLPEVSNTFHGRDIFAPVAAHLSLGVPLEDIGPPVQTLVQLPIQAPELSGNTLTGQIVKIDRFGNAITNISESAIAGLESASTGGISAYEIRIGSVRLNRFNRAYAESGVGKPLAIIGSSGLLEIAVNGGSAEKQLGLKRGDVIVIRKVDKSCQEI